MKFTEYRQESIMKLAKTHKITFGQDCIEEVDDICADCWSGLHNWDGTPETTDYCAILLKNHFLGIEK